MRNRKRMRTRQRWKTVKTGKEKRWRTLRWSRRMKLRVEMRHVKVGREGLE
jgi:hypothetical protein